MHARRSGHRPRSIQRRWRSLQLRDLRHEAGSRFDEAGVSTSYVSKLPGHASLTSTMRYLNIQRRGLDLAMEKLEESRKAAAGPRPSRLQILANNVRPAASRACV
jgi:integrase